MRQCRMRLLLTSNGITNATIHAALRDLIGGQTSDARLVVVIDAILPFAGDKSKLLEHLTALRELGWAEFDVVSLFAGPAALVEARLRAAYRLGDTAPSLPGATGPVG